MDKVTGLVLYSQNLSRQSKSLTKDIYKKTKQNIIFKLLNLMLIMWFYEWNLWLNWMSLMFLYEAICIVYAIKVWFLVTWYTIIYIKIRFD